MAKSPAHASKAELRRQAALDRRQQNAATIIDAEIVPTKQQLSFTGQALMRATPHDLVKQGLITFDKSGPPRVAYYDPTLLAPNPQRGRIADRGLDDLARSLDADGQQEAIIARLITDADRQRWPEAFNEQQILLILKGHRIYKAQPKSKLQSLRVEVLLPAEAEDERDYRRRALRRAAIKMMHSQGYDIFDKVNQYQIWVEEFSLQKPKKDEIAGYFDISQTEAQRLKVVANLDKAVETDIINGDRELADEVVEYIANRPPEEHREAYRLYGHLTVAAVRKLAKQARGKLETPVAAGRPRNYVFLVRDEDADILSISSALTPQQWKRKGGAKAFWDAIRALVNDRAIQERLKEDLG